MVVYLPNSLKVEMGGTTTKQNQNGVSPTTLSPRRKQGTEDVEPYSEYELLDWLPLSLRINTNESGDSIGEVESEWEWYFGNRFSWEKTGFKSDSNSYSIKSIAENSYSKNIAGKALYDYGSSEGYISLIPPDDGIAYSEFVKNTLQKVFDIDLNIEGRAPPSWLSDYTVPNEECIEEEIEEKKEQINELQEELESITRFKDLLYEIGDPLEEITREALRKVGFKVEDEIPGKRDGILQTSNTSFALEITGTTGGVKLSKCRQLDEWVENVTAESPEKDVSGLLIVNPEMDIPPEERDISIEPNVESYMKQRGDYKILTTIDLYGLVKDSIDGNLDREDIRGIFCQEDTLISTPEKTDD